MHEIKIFESMLLKIGVKNANMKSLRAKMKIKTVDDPFKMVSI